MMSGADPVRLDLLETLDQPGGNATGIYVFVTDLGPKRLQLLREVVPHATLIAFIVNLKSANGPLQKSQIGEASQRHVRSSIKLSRSPVRLASRMSAITGAQTRGEPDQLQPQTVALATFRAAILTGGRLRSGWQDCPAWLPCA
jgi:ABC-type uncharacterized transport system substrate-binding protein